MISGIFLNGSRDRDHASYGVVCHPKARLTLNMFCLNTTSGDSSFSFFGDRIAGVEIENGSCDPDHTPFRDGLTSH